MRIAKRWAIGGVLVAFATGAVGATAGQQRAEVGPTFKVAGGWGKVGTANGQFRNPFGIATDKAGKVYVADTDNGRVQVFTPKGAFVSKFGTGVGTGNGQFLGAQDVAVAPDGTMWVADLKGGGGRLQQFDANGGFLAGLSNPDEAWGVAVDAGGNIYSSACCSSNHGVVRFDKTPTGYAGAKAFVGGLKGPTDVEASADGSIYVADETALQVNRYDATGRLLKSYKAGVSGPVGVGVDLDCNVWVTNISKRQIERYSPQGKLLGTASSPDLVAQDVAVGLHGDLYVTTNISSVVHFTEDHVKPATAAVPGTISVVNGKAKVRFALPGVACPAQVRATATLAGKGVAGRLTTIVGAGKFTNLEIPVHGPAGKTVPATFKIVLKTNGRNTTQTKTVRIVFPK